MCAIQYHYDSGAFVAASGPELAHFVHPSSNPGVGSLAPSLPKGLCGGRAEWQNSTAKAGHSLTVSQFPESTYRI